MEVTKNKYMTAKELGNQPANSTVPVLRDNTGQFEIIESPCPGLSKREAFAMAAMQGLCSDGSKRDFISAAGMAAGYADALLEELTHNVSANRPPCAPPSPGPNCEDILAPAVEAYRKATEK